MPPPRQAGQGNPLAFHANRPHIPPTKNTPLVLTTRPSPAHPRTAGILLPAFTPRRNGDLGIGDTLALREWIDWAAEHHIAFLQILPINEHGADDSPYSAISTAAIDPIFLAFDIGQVPDLSERDLARAATMRALATQQPAP